MKSHRLSLLYALSLFASAIVSAIAADSASPAMNASSPRTGSHHVVFELTSSEPEAWNTVLNNIENLRKAFGETNVTVELVVHGKGLGVLRNSNREFEGRMQELAQAGVVFAACANTMKRQNVTKADLMSFATTVDSGVAEVVRKQESGWSYVHIGG